MKIPRAELKMSESDTFNQLLNLKDERCLTVHLATNCRPDTVDSVVVRLKNLIRTAESKLADSDWSKDPLAIMAELARTPDEWAYQGKGLVVFMSRDEQSAYSLPFPCEDQVRLDRRFHILPLLPFVQDTTFFYLLALSRDCTRLYRATAYDVCEVDLGDVPTSLKEDLRHDSFETSLQTHTGNAATVGGRRPESIFHGHGGGADDANVNPKLAHLFQHIDNAVCNRVLASNAPLVLVGLDHLQGIYRGINHCSHLVPDGVDHNADDLTPEQMRDRALEILRPCFQQCLLSQKERYSMLAGHGDERALKDMKAIVPAAALQRLDTLFLCHGFEQWGMVDVQGQSVELHAEPTVRSSELANFAAAETLGHGGRVFALDKEEMPAPSPMAAITRY